MREIRKSAVVRIAPLLAMALAGFDARAESFEPAPDGADVEAIVRRADRALHGEQTNLEGKLHVESRRGRTRESFRFRVFEDRLADRSFLRVEPLADEPSGSEPGVTFLHLPPNLWQFDPGEDKTMRLPREASRQALLDTAFGIDQLLAIAPLFEDYAPELLGVDPSPASMSERRAYVVEYRRRTPEERLWPRIVAWIDTEWGTPLRHAFFDEDGARVRVVDFATIRQRGDRWYPHLWRVRSGDPERTARIEIEGVAFDTEIDAEIFTPRHLKATP